MTDAAISFAVAKLGDAVIEKMKFLRGVAEQVQWVKDELQSMQCFLKDAEKQAHKERGNLVSKWICDVREVAQDAEDVIEMFTLKVEAPTRNRGLLGRSACFPVHVSHLYGVGEKIKSIRSTLVGIGERRERYGIGNLGVVGESSSRSRSEMVELQRRVAARFQKDEDVVGMDEDADLLLKNEILNEERKGLSIAAIVGMGGIGKSTLAWKIYNHPAVVAPFGQQRAFVVVSNEFEAEDIMKEIMQQLLSLEADESRSQDMHRKHNDRLKDVELVKDKVSRKIMLQVMLRQRLEGTPYFIVLDDVWEHTDWETLKNAFPDEQGKASRLLFTSRNQIITKHHGYIHEMRLLNSNDSWKLLLKTVGRSEGICPQDLEDIGREILKKCHGLPLAITVAGGLLRSQGESERGWQKVLKQMKEYHLETSVIGKNVSAILELSYHNLPSHLKPCFLCLGFFKEDAVIQAKKLVHIWVALGFVQVPKAGEESVEEIARSYLDELINRNLVLVKVMSINDRVKNCHVHDLLRELSIKKAKEEIGFESLICEDEGSCSSSSSSYKSRHRVVRGIGESLVEIDRSNQNKHLRSLFLNVDGPNYALTITPSYWKGFKLLRILDIEGSRLGRLPSRIRALIGLRYLRLREEGVLRLPSWLDVLKNLEVLDIADCKGVSFPNVTWRMDHLRHFYICRPHTFLSKSMKISSWKNLETFKYVSSDNLLFDNSIQGFSRNLRKLGVQVVDRKGEAEIGRLLVESEVQEVHLRWDGEWIDGFLPLPNSLEHLIKLKLHGRMDRCPAPGKFPQNITHLTLSESKITRNDPMSELGKLPNLLVLKLDSVLDYTHESMKVSHDGFPKLEILHLSRMHKLKKLGIEEGGMPQLHRLQIYTCPALQTENLRERIRSVEIIIVAD